MIGSRAVAVYVGIRVFFQRDAAGGEDDVSDKTDSAFHTERIGAPRAMRSHSSQDAAVFQTVYRSDGEITWTCNDVFVDEIVRLGPGG